MPRDLWSIVLAAGAGKRLAPLTAGAPKQFWRPRGASRSLLDATLARLCPLVGPERTVTVVDRSHRVHIDSLADQAALGEVVYQPMDRGTAAGVLLPLVTVLSRSPEAVVIITPSDHGVDDEAAFRHGLRQALARVHTNEANVVLFGIEPTLVASDYGWITPAVQGQVGGVTFQRVSAFVEKPPAFEACELFASGAVWNTMVLVAKASALLERYRVQLPFLADVLTTAAQLEAPARERFLAEWYPELPRADFSRDLLTHSRPLDLFTWPAEIGWSDLGTPERLEQWLARNATEDTPRARIGMVDDRMVSSL
jgi:mannose-1-phosphate guanylyltransferase